MAISALALAHIRRMLAKMASSKSVDQDWRGLYAVGGIMGILNGVLGLASSRMAYRLYSAGYPDTPAAYLQLVSQKQVLANFDAETTGKRTPDAEFIRKQPFAWRAPGIIIEVGFVEMLREGEGWRKGETWRRCLGC